MLFFFLVQQRSRVSYSSGYSWSVIFTTHLDNMRASTEWRYVHEKRRNSLKRKCGTWRALPLRERFGNREHLVIYAFSYPFFIVVSNHIKCIITIEFIKLIKKILGSSFIFRIISKMPSRWRNSESVRHNPPRFCSKTYSTCNNPEITVLTSDSRHSV